MRVLIGDRFGNIIGEMTPAVGPMAWILNGAGKITLEFAKTDTKATEENLRVGNRVYIEHDNGLPPWGGTLDMPFKWTNETVTVTGYEIADLFKVRPTRKNDAYYERPAGAILADLLQKEDDKDPLGITLGAIWVGGRPHGPRYNFQSMWAALTESIRKMESCDFTFTPYLDGNTIKFRADFYQRAGEDKTGSVALVEGQNITSDLVLTEQGTIINSHYAIGPGNTWGDERLVVNARDSESIAKYGLRSTGAVYSGVPDYATLEMYARNVIQTQSNPRRLFTLPVLNKEPGLFSAYTLGDSVRVILPTFGFGGYDGTLRVLARAYDPSDGACELTVEETNAPKTWIYQDEPLNPEV